MHPSFSTTQSVGTVESPQRGLRTDFSGRTSALRVHSGFRVFLRLLSVAVVFQLLATSTTFAQPLTLDASQFRRTTWASQDGHFRPGISAINSITQTTDGYIWVAGSGGIFRFDGVRFLEWTPPSGESLPRRPLHRLLAARDGSLWIAGIGLAQLTSDGKFRTYRELDGTEIEGGLIEDRDGAIWAGGAASRGGKPLCRFHRGASDCFGADSIFGGTIGVLYEDGKGQVWAGSATGVWKLRPGGPIRTDSSRPLASARSVAIDARGTTVVSSGGLTAITENGRLQPYELSVANARALLKAKDGSLWIGTSGQGIARAHDGRIDHLTTADGLSSNSVVQLFEDREGNVWAGTSRGVDKFTRPAVPTITAKQGLAIDYVNAVLIDRKGVLWAGTLNGLYQFIDGTWIKAPVQLPNEFVTSLFQTSAGRIFAATDADRGMTWIDGKKVTRFPSGDGDIFGLTEDVRGHLWVASHLLGLLHFDGNTKLVERFPTTTLGNMNVSIAYDHARDGVWLTSQLGDLGFFKDGKFVERYGPKDGLGGGILRDVQVDTDGSVWVSTRVGLAHLVRGKLAVLGRAHGLPCDAVHWMRRDNERNVWLYTECGMVALADSTLAHWVADSSRSVSLLQYLDNTDGVESVAYNGWYTPQTATTSDGRILYATATGIGILDPAILTVRKPPPPVHVEDVIVDGRSMGRADGLSFSSRAHTMQVAFSAPTFASPRKVRFRYRLSGYDTDWSAESPGREATYTNVPPGDYEFRVKASNGDGVWNEAGAALHFSVLPMFYQTLWFKALLAAAAAGLLWVLYALRLRQATDRITERLGERLQERERIARELHDTLLQDFQVIILRFDDVSRRLESPDPHKRALDEGLQFADRVLKEGRNRIHDIRADTYVSENLASAFSEYCNELARHRAVDCRVTVSGKPVNADPMALDEVFRIGREAIGNAFKHSECSTLEVELAFAAREFRLVVRDNGIGIDASVLATGRPGHWGIASMRERARKIEATLRVTNAPGAGTTLELTMPMRAFAKDKGFLFSLTRRAVRGVAKS